jgi:inorganic pyrophosphatase
VEESGEKYTPNYRVHFYFKDMETTAVKKVSPWHDIPYCVRDLVRTTPESVSVTRYNFICEIPKWTRAKFEISTGEAFNPIRQDMKNGVPRFYKHGDMMWNYGAFPQTWESTKIEFFEGICGDNDPIDGIEIGMTQLKTGDVVPVKVLGVLGMIDAGQMDWKIVCISHADPVAKFLDDIDDVPRFLPGLLEAMREWLRTYKICQGGTENKFAFDGEFKGKEFAAKLIKESHFMWQNLRNILQQENV